MDTGADQPRDEAPEVGVPDLLDLCRRLNEAGVQYLLYGGLACLLHDHERMTRDADILIGESEANIERALKALAGWGHGYATELRPRDLMEHVVVRISDVFVVDLACRAWGLTWADAWRNRRIITIQGVDVPILCRADLIKSKQTYREQDQWDARVLQSMTGPEPGRPAAL